MMYITSKRHKPKIVLLIGTVFFYENMDNMEFEKCYTYKNITYNVITTNDVHDKLQNGM